MMMRKLLYITALLVISNESISAAAEPEKPVFFGRIASCCCCCGSSNAAELAAASRRVPTATQFENREGKESAAASNGSDLPVFGGKPPAAHGVAQDPEKDDFDETALLAGLAQVSGGSDMHSRRGSIDSNTSASFSEDEEES